MKHIQQADPQSNLYQQLTQIQNLIRNRKDESDSELNNMFYVSRVINNEVIYINVIFLQKIQDQKRTQLVENDFFEKHPEYVIIIYTLIQYMNLEETLLILFERTLESSKDDHLQTILEVKQKLYNKKRKCHSYLNSDIIYLEKVLSNKKNFITQDAFKKRRRSKYDHRSNTGSQQEKEDVPTIILDKDNQEILINENNLYCYYIN